MDTTMTWWPVALDLAGLIDAVYVLRTYGARFEALAGALLPQVQWQLAGRYAWRCRDEAMQPLPPSRIGALGPSTAAIRFETAGDTVVVGTGLFPEGWARLLPMAAGSVTERMLDLHALWGDVALAPLALDPSLPDAALARAVEGTIRTRLADAGNPPDPRIAAISRWADGDDHDINALAAELGLSRRQVTRLTVASNGLPPRVLVNRHKILRMAAVLALGHDIRREVWTAEYADQPHFNRNFRRFIGVSPTRFMAEPEVFVRGVMRARFAIASKHPLGLAPDAGRIDPASVANA